MDKDPTEDAGFDAGQVDSIQNLDTARMALRWALERLRALEAVNQELSKKAEWEFRMRAKAEEDFKRQWESEKSHSEDVLKRREVQYERDFAAKIGEWERAYQALAEELRSKERRADDDAQGRLTGVQALESDLAARKAALEGREREFESFCALQKSGVEAERRKMREEAAREAECRLAAMEQLVQERFSALSGAWRGEKEALESQAVEWRRQAETERRRTRETEERLEALEPQARRSAQEASDLRADAARRQAEIYAREIELRRAAEVLREEFEKKRDAVETLKRRALTELKRLVARRGAADSGSDPGKPKP